MASVMYIIRSVQYFVPSLLIVTSVYSLELVEKNVTLLYTTVQRSVSPQDACVKYSLSFEGARTPPLVSRLASSYECK